MYILPVHCCIQSQAKFFNEGLSALLLELCFPVVAIALVETLEKIFLDTVEPLLLLLGVDRFGAASC